MTQYSTNANFSTDTAGTAESASTTTGITGFTFTHPTTSGTNVLATITAGGVIGANYVRISQTGWGSDQQFISQNGPGNIAANTETDELFLFRFNALPASGNAGLFGQIRALGSNGWGYGLQNDPSGSITLAFWKGGNPVATIGNSVAKALRAGVWYWARIHVTSDASPKWSWKVWAGSITSEPSGWDQTAVVETTPSQTSGFVGVGANFASTTMPVDYAWFSSATGPTDIAPGPAAPSGWDLPVPGAVARAVNTNTTALPVPYPSNIPVGAAIWLAVGIPVAGDTLTLTEPSGVTSTFTLAASRTTNLSTYLYWKIANGTESGNLSVAASDNHDVVAQMAWALGAPVTVTGNVIDTASSGFAPNTEIGWPAMTITANKLMVMAVGVKNENGSLVNIPAPWTGRISEFNDSFGATLFIWDYVIQGASGANIATGQWTVNSGDASQTTNTILAAFAPGGAALAGGAVVTAAGSATLIENTIAGAAALVTTAQGALTTAIRAAANANASVTAQAALTNWTTVTLSGALYTGPGGILDPNFWVSVLPQDGTTLFYDATHITIATDGEIVSDSNNCSALVQFFDGVAWSVGLVVITPNIVSYPQIIAAATGALTTAINLAGVAIETSQVAGQLASAIQLVTNALVIANASAGMLTAIQMTAGAVAGTAAGGALTGGVASLTGVAVATVQALASLTAQIQLAGQVTADSTVAGAITAQTMFAAAANALTQAAGQLNTAIQLSGNAVVATSEAGAVLLSTLLAGIANSVSTAVGSLTTGLLFAGNALVTSAGAGTLGTGIQLAGTAEVDTAAAVQPAGLESQFGYAVVTVLSPTGLPVAQPTFIENSACIAEVSYFNAQGAPFIPSAVSYRVDDVASGANLVPWTQLTPALSNAVTVTAQQNTMVNGTRASEQHQILFQIVDGLDETNYASEVYDLVRLPGLG